MTPVVILAAVLFGYGMNPSSSLYAGYAERPYAGYAETIAGFEIAEAPACGTVEIVGDVVRPGVYHYYPSMTVSSAIGDAGSFMRGADYDNIRVVRTTSAGEQSFRLSYYIMPHRLALLKPGDKLVVPDRLH